MTARSLLLTVTVGLLAYGSAQAAPDCPNILFIMSDDHTTQGIGCYGSRLAKWHNGSVYPYHPNGRGFDEFFGFCCGHWGHYFDPSLEHNGRPVQAKGFIADVFTDRAIDYIEKKAGEEEPFLCWLAFCTPHSPFQVVDADWAKIADRDLSMKNRDADKERPVSTRGALALVENIDGNVGRLVAKLDQLGVREDTIVIYLSDNGPNTWRWNDGMRGKKGSVEEGGVRVPRVSFCDFECAGSTLCWEGAQVFFDPSQCLMDLRALYLERK